MVFSSKPFLISESFKKLEIAQKKKCSTVGGASLNASCVLPFNFDNKKHYSCIYGPFSDGYPWCSTKVNENGTHISESGHWGYCSDSCPIENRSNTTPYKRIILLYFNVSKKLTYRIK